MATFVLVHGAWHGGWCYRDTAKALRDAGHTVFTPTHSGLGVARTRTTRRSRWRRTSAMYAA